MSLGSEWGGWGSCDGGAVSSVLDGRGMPDEWALSVVLPIFMEKGDAMHCGACRGVKIVEKVLERRMWHMVKVDKVQFGFMPGKGTMKINKMAYKKLVSAKHTSTRRSQEKWSVNWEMAYKLPFYSTKATKSIIDQFSNSF